MTMPQLSERSVRIAVLGFSVVGLIALTLIASLTEVDEIGISELNEHLGERVRIKGTMIGNSHSGSDSAWIMLREENESLEVFIERGDGNILPGSIVTADGEVVTIDGEPTLSVQNEERLVVENGEGIRPVEEGIIPGKVHFVIGIVRACSYEGWDQQEITISPINDHPSLPNSLVIHVLRFEEEFRTGDLLNLTAFFIDNSNGISYGEQNIRLLSRAEPRTVSLLRLVEEMRDDPSSAPYEPLTLDGYLKYTPLGRSIYISDLIEGGDISIKAKLPTPLDGAEKGDLVRLYNCSMAWDAESMRFELASEEAAILESYGPWKLNLENLKNGLIEFEGVLVELVGTVIEEGTSQVLISGGVSVKLCNWMGDLNGDDTVVVGRVMFDSITNSLYIETGVEIS
jgi:hypothetical protein